MGRRLPSGNSGGEKGCLKQTAYIVGIMLLCTAAPLALVIDSVTR